MGDIKEGLQHIERLARGEGEAALHKLVEGVDRTAASRDRTLYERLSKTELNRNLDFRIYIFDPLIQVSAALVRKYGDDYNKIRREIEKDGYRSEGWLFLEGVAGGLLPSATGVASAGAAGGMLSWLASMMPYLRLKSTEFDLGRGDFRDRVRIVFRRLVLEKFCEEIADVQPGDHNHGRYTRVWGLLSYEAEEQVKWDKQIAPKAEWGEASVTMRLSGFMDPPRPGKADMGSDGSQGSTGAEASGPAGRDDAATPERTLPEVVLFVSRGDQGLFPSSAKTTADSAGAECRPLPVGRDDQGFFLSSTKTEGDSAGAAGAEGRSLPVSRDDQGFFSSSTRTTPDSAGSAGAIFRPEVSIEGEGTTLPRPDQAQPGGFESETAPQTPSNPPPDSCEPPAEPPVPPGWWFQ